MMMLTMIMLSEWQWNVCRKREQGLLRILMLANHSGYLSTDLHKHFSIKQATSVELTWIYIVLNWIYMFTMYLPSGYPLKLGLFCGYYGQYIGMPYIAVRYIALTWQAWIYRNILETLCRPRSLWTSVKIAWIKILCFYVLSFVLPTSRMKMCT